MFKRAWFSPANNMTSTKLRQLRAVLEARQADLEQLHRNREVIAVESSADILDHIQHASERDITIGNLERESARLREVRAALGRIDLGTFGICLVCDEEISLKRLTAVPWMPSCLRCQEAADRSQSLVHAA
jgi:DnaK suppressor protein